MLNAFNNYQYIDLDFDLIMQIYVNLNRIAYNLQFYFHPHFWEQNNVYIFTCPYKIKKL